MDSYEALASGLGQSTCLDSSSIMQIDPHIGPLSASSTQPVRNDLSGFHCAPHRRYCGLGGAPNASLETFPEFSCPGPLSTGINQLYRPSKESRHDGSFRSKRGPHHQATFLINLCSPSQSFSRTTGSSFSASITKNRVSETRIVPKPALCSSLRILASV